MYSRANQFPQSIFLSTKTSVYPNLVVPPHSGEKPINEVREARKVISKGYPMEIDFIASQMTELSLTDFFPQKHRGPN